MGINNAISEHKRYNTFYLFFSFFKGTLLFKNIRESRISIFIPICTRLYNIRKVYIEMVVLSINGIC
jgi:hypothetical protein